MQPVDNNIWVVEQPLKFMGLSVRTRMTVIRLIDNCLLLISPIHITKEIKQQLDSLGKVKYLIAPNLFHYLYLTESQKIYPKAEVVAPPQLEKKLPNLKIDRVFMQDEIDFNFELEYFLFKEFQVLIGTKIKTVNEIVFYHPSSKTLIITDSAFNFDDTFPLVTQLAARILGSYKILKPSWLEKIAIQDKQEAKKSIDKILAWDFTRVIRAY